MVKVQQGKIGGERFAMRTKKILKSHKFGENLFHTPTLTEPSLINHLNDDTLHSFPSM